MRSFHLEPLEARIAPATLTISAPTTVKEGTNSTVDFTITLSEPAPAGGAAFHFSTVDGTATAADNDYTPINQDFFFEAGETTKVVKVTLNNDTRYELDEKFSAKISNPVNATIATGGATAEVIVQSDDPPPTVSISGGTVVEGSTGQTSKAIFTVTLSEASSQPVTIKYNTADDTSAGATERATAGADYSTKGGSITIPAGQTSATIEVSVIGDSVYEHDETFLVTLTEATNGTLSSTAASGTMTIHNDDAVPTITIVGGDYAEGNPGQPKSATFTVKLSNPSAFPVTGNWLTEDGTALAGSDYVAGSGTFTIPALSTTASFTVDLVGDTKMEANEQFHARLSDVQMTGTTAGEVVTAPGGLLGTATILNDETRLIITNQTILEGHNGDREMVFTVQLQNSPDINPLDPDHPVPQTNPNVVTVDFSTLDYTATAGSDYVAKSGTLTFQPGETTKEIHITIHGDTEVERPETFGIQLNNPKNAFIDGSGLAIGTIQNDDIAAGYGQTDAIIDLGSLLSTDPATAAGGHHTFVEFKTNYIDPSDPTHTPKSIIIELYDNIAPLTVQNFLYYVQNMNAAGDYDGVFFHRLVSNFVLQAGGFNATNVKTHIPTGPVLHNEFDTAWAGYDASATDDLKANVRGTIAMAKLEGDPDSATSEFYFNLADNSSSLDFLNGGYTVFGKVTDDSMAVVDAIAHLSTKNFSDLNGALGQVPVQNPTITVPVAGNLVQITSAKIISDPAGPDPGDPGHSYSVVSVVDAITGKPSKLVNPVISGDTLDLKFNPKASGMAKVKVHVTPTDGSPAFDEEFFVTKNPELISHSAGTTLSSVIVPGDTGLAKVKIVNTGAAAAKGQVSVKFYLSQVNAADPTGTILDASDILISPDGTSLHAVNIAPGKSATVAGKVQIPMELVSDLAHNQYRIIAMVNDGTEGTIFETFAGESTRDGSLHSEYNVFGTLHLNDGTVRKNVEMKIKDATGHVVNFSLTGGGFGSVNVNQDSSLDLFVRGTAAASKLAVRTEANADHFSLRNVSVGNINSAEPLGVAALGNVDLQGDFVAYGGLKSLTLGDLPEAATPGTDANADAHHFIGIGTSAALKSARPVVSLGSAVDTTLHSQLPLTSLSAGEWRTVDSVHEEIEVAGLGALRVNGNLEADVHVLGRSTVSAVTVGGVLKNAEVQIAGGVGKVLLGAMNGSDFTAGYQGAGKPLTHDAIASFTIKGASDAQDLMADSTVRAYQFGSISVQNVDADSGTDAFGFVAHAIKSYQRDSVRLVNLIASATTPANNVRDQQGHYQVTLETMA